MAGSEERTGFDWGEVLTPAVTVAVVAFVVLQIKEYVDAGLVDTPGTMMDALLVAGGMLVLKAIQQFMKKPPAS
jgi:mannose/fructose/N-acetylgalactosamine-specific phosphotransferase system component IIC